MERKKIGQIQKRICRRMLACNPTIRHVILNLYTKYDFSSLQGCGEIFDEKVLRNYGRTDGQTDGRTDGMTDRCKPVYPPTFSKRGYNHSFYICIPYLMDSNVRLAGGHLYGKQLFTWLSLVASFVLSFFPLDVLDEIWDLIESVSEGFLTYSLILNPTIQRNIVHVYTKFQHSSFKSS